MKPMKAEVWYGDDGYQICKAGDMMCELARGLTEEEEVTDWFLRNPEWQPDGFLASLFFIPRKETT